ncbi:MAG: alpha/beta hydrolase [Bacteroidota bacterium]|nr:alpha/beta hydrolase [Bacteroidota bacterium]
MKQFFLLLLLVSLQTFAQQKEPDYNKVAIESAKYWLDVDYVGDGLIGHKLDIHLPLNGKAPYPVIICIYGSAWKSNNAKAATFTSGLGQRLLQEGFAVVSINHRSISDAIFPAQIQDVKAAIRFVRAKSATFSLNPNFIGITGWSSGGHLSALIGTTNNSRKSTIKGLEVDIEGSLGKFTQTSSSVNAVVEWFGPSDFLIMGDCGSEMKHNDHQSPESLVIGGPIQENKAKTALANPATYADNQDPPFLIFHGNKDRIVPYCQSEKLYQRLQQEGVPSELIIVPNGEHGPGVMIDKYYDQKIMFFQNKLKSSKK